MTMRRCKRLTVKLFLLFVLILLLSLFFEGSIIYRSFLGYVTESLDASTQLVMESHSRQVNDFFRKTETLCDLISTEIPSMAPLLEEDTGNFYDAWHNYRYLHKRLQTLCDSVIGSDIRYKAVLFLHEDFPMTDFLSSPEEIFLKKSVKEYVSSPFHILSERNLLDSAWFQSTGQADSSFWFMEPENNDTIWIAKRMDGLFLFDGLPRHYSIGTFLIGIDVSWITGQMEGLFSESDSLFFITDRYGRIVYAKDPGLLNRNLDDICTFEDVNVSNSAAQKKRYARMQDVSYLSWEQNLESNVRLCCLTPVQFYNRQIRIQLQTFLGMSLLVILVGILLTALFSRYVTRPVKALSRHMEKQSLTPIAPYRSQDEIGILYRSFNQMVEKQEALIQQTMDYAERQKQLKFQILQAQINPHFLYNTLDSVGCAAMIQGQTDLTDTLSCLVSLLRYNINDPEQLVTLAEELQIVEDYISIQRFRYGDLLLYSSQVSREATACKIPKTIIQPLVENAVQYGGRSPDGACRISLQVINEREKGNILIHICNDVPSGKTAKDLAALLNACLSGQRELARSSSGLGVINVQQRIQFVFGEAYGLRYERDGDRIICVVLLPCFE